MFRSDRDYRDFIALLYLAQKRHPVDIYAFCLMPNHFHLVARTDGSEQLSALMQWWLTSHVRRMHRLRGTSGHIWQGRFKSFPVQEDVHLLTVLRYVLLNPCRAGLVGDATHWRWSSLRFPRLVAPWPVSPTPSLSEWLSAPEEDEAAQVNRCIQRGTPFGEPDWREATARAFGLESTLRPRGRPRYLEPSAKVQSPENPSDVAPALTTCG